MSNKGTKKSKKTPFFKKWWFWVTIIIVLIGIASVTGGNHNEPTKVGSNTSSSEQKSKEKTDFTVGDVIAYDSKEITVVSVQRNYNSGNAYYKPESGKEFIKISIKIENKSSSKIPYSAYDWEIQDSNGDIQDVNAGLQFTVDGALSSGDLAPDGKKSADLYFQVPSDDANLVLHYKSSLWSDKTVNIKL